MIDERYDEESNFNENHPQRQHAENEGNSEEDLIYSDEEYDEAVDNKVSDNYEMQQRLIERYFQKDKATCSNVNNFKKRSGSSHNLVENVDRRYVNTDINEYLRDVHSLAGKCIDCAKCVQPRH